MSIPALARIASALASAGILDAAWIERWRPELGVESEWAEALRRAGGPRET